MSRNDSYILGKINTFAKCVGVWGRALSEQQARAMARELWSTVEVLMGAGHFWPFLLAHQITLLWICVGNAQRILAPITTAVTAHPIPRARYWDRRGAGYRRENWDHRRGTGIGRGNREGRLFIFHHLQSPWPPHPIACVCVLMHACITTTAPFGPVWPILCLC